MSSANTFKLDLSQILSFGKELNIEIFQKNIYLFFLCRLFLPQSKISDLVKVKSILEYSEIKRSSKIQNFSLKVTKNHCGKWRKIQVTNIFSPFPTMVHSAFFWSRLFTHGIVFPSLNLPFPSSTILSISAMYNSATLRKPLMPPISFNVFKAALVDCCWAAKRELKSKNRKLKPLPHIPILDSSNSAANKNMIS